MPVADSGGVGGGKKDKDDKKGGKGGKGGGAVPTAPTGGGKGGGKSPGGGSSTPGGGTSGGGSSSGGGGGTRDQDPPVGDNFGGTKFGGGKGGPGGTNAINQSYLDQAANLQGQANALLDALKNEIGSARDQQISDILQLMRQQDNMLMEGYRKRYGMLEGASLDNDVSQASDSTAAQGNMLRERNAALSELSNQGAGESDAIAAQLMSLRNWNANQGEVQRSYNDTLRSINSSLTDLNVDTKTARINNEIQANADLEQLWTNFYNQQSELWTQLGNTYGQQADLYAQADAYGKGSQNNGGNGNGGGRETSGTQPTKPSGGADWGPQPGDNTGNGPDAPPGTGGVRPPKGGGKNDDKKGGKDKPAATVPGTTVPKNWSTGNSEASTLGNKAASKLLGNAAAGGINKPERKADLKDWLKDSTKLSNKQVTKVVKGKAGDGLMDKVTKQTGVKPGKPPKGGGGKGGGAGAGNGGGNGNNPFGGIKDPKPDNANEAADNAADAFGNAADSLGKDWDNPGISSDLRDWQGKDLFKAQNNNLSRLDSAQTIKKMKAPEGATLRRW